MKKSIISLVLLYFLFFNSVNLANANDEYKEQLKTLKKELKSTKIENNGVNKNYLDKQQEIYILQLENHKYNASTKTSKEIVDITKKLYGENSQALAQTLLQQTYLFLDIKEPKGAKKTLNELEIIVENIEDKEIVKRYHKALFDFYSTFESPFKAKETLEILLKEKNMTRKEKLEYLNLLIMSSHGSYNVEDTKKYLDDYYSLNIKLYGEDNKTLIDYYRKLLNFKLIVQCDYPNFVPVYEKLMELTEKYGNQREQQLQNNLLLVDFYIKTNSLEKAKAELDKIKEDIETTNNYYLKYPLNFHYLTYYTFKNDKKNQKIYKNKLADLNKEFNKERVVSNVYFNERLVDYYKFQDNYRQAQTVSNNIIELLEEYKEEIPVVYGKFLKNNALIKRDIGDFDGALNHLYKSEKSYLKELPEISYPIYETTIEFAILHMLYSRYYEAIPYYKKAKTICLKMFGRNHRDTLKVCENMANNYFYAGMKEEAIKELDEAILIAINLFGEDNPKTKELKTKKEMFLNKKTA